MSSQTFQPLSEDTGQDLASGQDAAASGGGALADLADLAGNDFMQSLMFGGSDSGCDYTVRSGDTLWDIALQHGTTVDDIHERNREVIGDDPDLIFPDQQLALCEDEEEETEVLDEALDEGAELSPEEQLAAAEAARDGLEERLGGLERLPEEERALVLSRVQGLSGEALVREMRMIENALSGPNGDRALHALAGLETMLQEDPDAAARLTPDIVEMMVNGVADRRSDSERGQEGVMGASHVRNAAQALLDMSDDQYAQAVTMLESAGLDADGNAVEGANAGTEQALILKAIGARQEQIDTNIFQDIWSFFGGETEADRAMDDVQTFADTIRGMDRDELVRQTTLLDVHDENTSNIDPRNITAHLDADPTNDDQGTDNDALFQRFSDSCAPTTSQIVRGEIDPIFAMQIHKDDADPSNGTATAEQQRQVLEENGGVAVSRLGSQASQDLTSSMDAMQAAGTLSPEQRQAMQQLATGAELSPEQQALSQQALETIRAANNGRPSDAELTAMQSNAGRSGDGMVTATALDEIVSDPTGVEFDYTDTESAGVGAGDLDAIEQALFDGQEVPFRVKWSSGGHAMMIADVRRDESGNRSFLMSEPVSGATRWVSEADLQSGAFTNGTFGIGNGTVRGYFTEDQD